MKARSKYCLVILTTHFGINFSGGSTATCEIFSRIEAEFSEVIVVGTQLGKHPFNSIQFLQYKNWVHALLILNRLKSKETIFYGDFYNTFLFILLNLPFFFTYHDNWPEQAKVSFKNKLQAFFYVPIYKSIFKKAKLVFTVSEFKCQYIRQFTQKVELVYNGFNHNHSKGRIGIAPKKSVLMVGNIDSRKYKLALELFQLLKKREQELSIDIYGNVRDERLARKLNEYPFVNLKGFYDTIPFSAYKLLLHTSITESFGMIFCEAIHQRIPVLTFNVGGAKEVVNADNGNLVAPYDVKQMQIELEKMLNGAYSFHFNQNRLNDFSWDKASYLYSKYLKL